MTSARSDRFVDLGPVHTWYDDRGAGDAVVLLHGGLTDSRDFRGNLDALADRCRVLMPERRGHGHTPDVDGPIDLDSMAADTVRFIEEVVGGPTRLVGFSAGAQVALRVVMRRPDLVDRLVLISGGFDYGSMIVRPARDASLPARAVARHDEVTPDGAGHAHVVGAKMNEAIWADRARTPEELAAVDCPTLVMAADDDVWTFEHTLALYRGLPDAELAVVPGTSHGLLIEKPALCRELVWTFLTTRSNPLAPIRRAGSDGSPWAAVTS